QAGYHMADGACPIAAGSWEAIKRSADTAAEAALMVREGASWVYALSRPPGHHAFADMAGGFCYVNNSGVAAQVLRGRHDRVAILDVDVHHGNGTQGMFYRRADVMTVSIHADPVRFYPFFWGHADERGEDMGLGYNYNLPLPRGTDDESYEPALAAAMRRIEAFAPGALVVALGLDAYKEDPQGGFAITTGGFGRIGEMIGRLGLPTVLVQEGGYLCDDLAANLTCFLEGFGTTHKS
ncbi:histone deacetylase family protein, partial [Parvibaculum sp.]|uniref:histone deacetylase family protein n=1 Tax=Parvibaculum sp. TaxID=2024848 RepID=UPI0034A05A7A